MAVVSLPLFKIWVKPHFAKYSEYQGVAARDLRLDMVKIGSQGSYEVEYDPILGLCESHQGKKIDQKSLKHRSSKRKGAK